MCGSVGGCGRSVGRPFKMGWITPYLAFGLHQKGVEHLPAELFTWKIHLRRDTFQERGISERFDGSKAPLWVLRECKSKLRVRVTVDLVREKRKGKPVPVCARMCARGRWHGRARGAVAALCWSLVPAGSLCWIPLLDPRLLDPRLLDPRLLDPRLLDPSAGSTSAGSLCFPLLAPLLLPLLLSAFFAFPSAFLCLSLLPTASALCCPLLSYTTHHYPLFCEGDRTIVQLDEENGNLRVRRPAGSLHHGEIM